MPIYVSLALLFISELASLSGSPAKTTLPMSGIFIEPSLFIDNYRLDLSDQPIEFQQHLRNLKYMKHLSLVH